MSSLVALLYNVRALTHSLHSVTGRSWEKLEMGVSLFMFAVSSDNGLAGATCGSSFLSYRNEGSHVVTSIPGSYTDQLSL